MATVIRSARILSEPVMLPAHGNAVPPALAERPPDMPIESEARREPPAIYIQQPAPSVENDSRACLSAELDEREKQLVERERRLKEDMEAERGRVSKHAYDEGFQRGEQEAARLHRDRLNALQELIESLKKEFASEIAGLEDVVVSIAFEAICKIVGEAMYDTDGVLAVVRTVMGKVRDQEKLVLHVSPRDYNLLYQNREQLFAEGQGVKHELVPDDRVVFGGCLIETAGGTIDGRLDIQLQQLRDTLIGARKMLPE